MERLDIYKRKDKLYESEMNLLERAGISNKNKEIIKKYYEHLFTNN